MDKQNRHLNILLAAMVAVGILSPFIVNHNTHQVQPIQMNLADMEVTQDMYKHIGVVATSCDLEDTLRLALKDNKVSYTEASNIGELCKQQMLDSAVQPFERGKLKQELNYIQNGGVSM